MCPKLQVMGVHPVLLRWVGAFLSGRRQRVRVGQLCSSWKHIQGGVPQGSWFGPLLFTVLINDLDPDCDTQKYMDDATLSESTADNISRMQMHTDYTQEWSKQNEMIPNPKKTKEMVICFKQTPPSFPPLTVANNIIDTVTSFRLLGLHINNKLTWNDHVVNVYRKASQRLYFLKLLKRAGLDKKDLVTFYSTCVRSVVEYASPVWWSSLTKQQKHTLENVQNRALKIIYPGVDHSTALNLANLHTLSDRAEIAARKLFAQITTNPDHPLHTLLPDPNVHTYNLRKKLFFQNLK